MCIVIFNPIGGRFCDDAKLVLLAEAQKFLNGKIRTARNADVLSEMVAVEDYLGFIIRSVKAKKSKKSSEESLRRYQLLYAIGIEDEREEILAPKQKRKKSVPKQDSVPLSAEKKTESYEGDSTTSLADTLDATTKRIFECIPQDKAISADAIVLPGVSVADIITALTLLELYGLVCSLPGGLYMRK